jgi:hypothetical protein
MEDSVPDNRMRMAALERVRALCESHGHLTAPFRPTTLLCRDRTLTLGLRKYLERPNRRIDAVFISTKGDSLPLSPFNPTASRSRWD